MHYLSYRDSNRDIVQVTSHKAPQFVCGRFLVYTAVGLVENVRHSIMPRRKLV